jgi:hypothetical protein
MAIYHYSQKPVARARGQSAVAGAEVARRVGLTKPLKYSGKLSTA